MSERMVFQAEMDSPLGRLRLFACPAAVTGIYLPEQRVPPRFDGAAAGHPVLDETRRQLDEYFAGRRSAFSVPLDPAGTEFQRLVWAALQGIPHGQTRSYGALAAQLGRPRAARAVGEANARNPISILIPCHRVIGAGGDLRGYAGGLSCKQWLLAHESGSLSACHWQTSASDVPAENPA